MDGSELAARIDHTVLEPTTTPDDVECVLEQARRYGMNACVPPCYVSAASDHAPEVPLVTVVGFPHGHHTAAVKRQEAERAWDDGADELDVVIAVGRLTAGDTAAVRRDIEEVVASVPVPVKAIVETALLSDDEKRDACLAAKDADADFVKTSTGFADGGATVPDVELMSEYLPVKASGGISDFETAKAMLDAGAERVGASSGVEILEDFRENHG